MLVLVIADLFIPLRAKAIPQELNELLQKDTYDLIVSTGNLGDKSVHSYFKELGKLVVIDGGHDVGVKGLEDTAEAMAGELKIGVTRESEFDKIQSVQRKLAADIVIHKSPSHTCTAFSKKGVVYVCPGSASGAFSLSHHDVTPSFLVLEIIDTDVNVYQYSCENDELHVTGKTFTITNPLNAKSEE
eukprot:TRINITY_DN448_c0_g1_i1.p1 TRINITY_DN448_c0_g1~~TRINITY_DN448_c0_g1_i1.p1  ORF type:complete len:202 (+),score=62.28 TRINITY_DN448_c0_g1_i1:46-606(+)